MDDIESQIQKVIDFLQVEFSQLQIGRANPSLVSEILVASYGSQTPLKSLANISCPDAKTLRIEPWDKSLINDIEKTIQTSGMGINPQNMGDHLFLPIPPMTEERRKEMVKNVRELEEKAKISVRNIRQKKIKEIKQQKEDQNISEDQQRDEEETLQKIVDKATASIDSLAKNKEKDILTV